MVFTMSEEDVINCTISHEIHQYLFSCVYILVLLIGVPSNLYSLYHAALQLKQKNELGVYLMNLTLSDLLYLASLPLWLQYIFQDDDWRHREWLCQLCGFLLYENIYISIGFLCCISLDRYLAVVHPLRFTSLRSMSAAWLVSAIIWLKEIAISYLCVLRAVGRSAGTQPDQKMRVRQLVSSTILIFLVCFSPYHIFLLVRTLLERDCNFIAAIFNYYHLSLLLTSLNCVADPALYCFVSESARRGLYRAILRPVARILCCCCRRGNASPGNPATDSHEVATDENNGHPTVMLLTHTSTLNNLKIDTSTKNTTSITQSDEKTIKPLTVQSKRLSHKCTESSCMIATEEHGQKTIEESDKNTT
ncbi:G-protein coupled receptor 68 isoform X3 [Chaetodon auriga]|uniref:G-protein coupled receptor 68 isoform X3 n=1 Tax=Chaetodon auriga TaxID=39042 RepID=UPI004032EEE6